MNDFKKGLTIGILLMSSVFLLMAQTKAERKEFLQQKMDALEKTKNQYNETNKEIKKSLSKGIGYGREIVDYKIVEYDYDLKKRNRT